MLAHKNKPACHRVVARGDAGVLLAEPLALDLQHLLVQGQVLAQPPGIQPPSRPGARYSPRLFE